MIMLNLITLVAHTLLGSMIGGTIEVFLYSFLHAYYCFEYKTAAMEVDI